MNTNIKHSIKIISIITLLSMSYESIGRSCQDFQADLKIINNTSYNISCTLGSTTNVRANGNYPSSFKVLPYQTNSKFSVSFIVASLGSQSGLPEINYSCTVLDANNNGGVIAIPLSATFNGNPFYPCSFTASVSANWGNNIGTGWPMKKYGANQFEMGPFATANVAGASGATVTFDSSDPPVS